jgi:hypothetical protein
MQDDILKLAYEVSAITESKIHLIDSVMRQARFLSINAHIEAARAGQAGVAFTILADEMGKIASTITSISNELRAAITDSTGRLHHLGTDLVLNHKGSRFTDLALNVIELIDRNLYERSCDVRWWATDSAVVDAASTSLQSDFEHACERLHTILKSYTVYLDLCIADRAGKIIACGRPNLYTGQIGTDISGVEWFRNAMQTKSGDDFVVADVRRSPALNNAITATYATAIRENGEANGKIIGALGIAFDWLPQAQAIVQGVHLTDDEKATTRVMIVDAAHRVIAASDDAGILTETLPFEPAGPRGFYVRDGRLIAYALTPGYETYRGLGWYGVIETKIEG